MRVLLIALALVSLLLPMATAPAIAHTNPAAPDDLVVERLDAPLEVADLKRPALSWKNARDVDQERYQVRVASHPDPVKDADVWDSDPVESSQSVDVDYEGPELESAQRYWWSVRIHNGKGWSDWASAQTFGTAPTQEWDQAETIWAPEPEAWGEDFTLEFSAQFLEKHTSVAFRAQNSGNLYLWQFRGDGENELALHAIKDFDPAPSELKVVPLDVELETGEDAPFYSISIRAEGSKIQTFLDGELIDETIDETFTSGGIGFRTGAQESFAVKDVRLESAGGEVLYESDFNESNEFSCGEREGDSLIIPRGQSQGCLYFGQWGDYDWEADVTVEEVATGVIFRAVDNDNYYMWQLRGDDSTVVPHTKKNGSFTALDPSEPITPAVEIGETVTMRIETRGETITTYIDDHKVDERQESTFRSGGVGFRNGLTERGTFENLTVTTPSGEELTNTEEISGNPVCTEVEEGVITVDKGVDCVVAGSNQVSSDWSFLRGEFTPSDKEITAATLYASGASTLPAHQYVYRVYVNGGFVGLGPTQPMDGENRFDAYDITDLVQGNQANAIGALAYTKEDQQFIGLVAVTYADGSRELFATGPDWKAMPGHMVYPEAGSIGTNFYQAPVENLNAVHYPFGFATTEFDDSLWLNAKVTTPLQDLQPTLVGKVQEELKAPERIEEKGPGHYFIDFGRTWLGGVQLTLDAEEAGQIEVLYGEELEDADSSANTVRWRMRTGNNYRDTYTYKPGAQQLQNWGMRAFRYVEIVGAPHDMTSENIQATALIHPFDASVAQFSSDDSDLVDVWQLSKNTIEALNGNLYVDTWTRERINYEADSFIQLQSNLYLDEDPSLGWYSMEYLLTRRTWPTEWPMYVVLGMHELWQATGDSSIFDGVYDKLLTKLPQQYLEEETGLIRKQSGSDGGNSKTDDDIVDWPAGERDGYQFREYNTVVNALAYEAYRNMAEIAEEVGRMDDAEEFRNIAQRMKESINEHLYDPDKGAYRDGMDGDHVTTDHWALHASVWPQAFGITPEEERERVGEYLADKGMQCSVYCAPFLLKALYDGEQGDSAYQLLTSTDTRSWLNMIAQGAGATMEAWDTSLKSNTSFSHPWASSPAFMIPRGMFGIRPLEPGYEAFSVKPQPGGLNHGEITVPTPRGLVYSAFNRVGEETDLMVQVPHSATAVVQVPSQGATDNEVYVNGESVQGVPSGEYLEVELPQGCYFLSVDGSRDLDDSLFDFPCEPSEDPEEEDPDDSGDGDTGEDGTDDGGSSDGGKGEDTGTDHDGGDRESGSDPVEDGPADGSTSEEGSEPTVEDEGDLTQRLEDLPTMGATLIGIVVAGVFIVVGYSLLRLRRGGRNTVS